MIPPNIWFVSIMNDEEHERRLESWTYRHVCCSLLLLVHQKYPTVSVFPIKRPDSTMTSRMRWYQWAAIDADNLETLSIGDGNTGSGSHANTGKIETNVILRNEILNICT